MVSLTLCLSKWFARRLRALRLWLVHVVDHNRLVLPVGLLWLSVLAVTHAWPAAWWMEVTAVRVADAQAGQPVPMYVDRRIHRDFVGTWAASVRDLSDGTPRVSCAASAVAEYRTGAELPQKIDLGWWTNGRCETLPAGRYVVNTTWVIHGRWMLPEKQVQAVSNIFEVHAND